MNAETFLATTGEGVAQAGVVNEDFEFESFALFCPNPYGF
jgi:hypothetical protein